MWGRLSAQYVLYHEEVWENGGTVPYILSLSSR